MNKDLTEHDFNAITERLVNSGLATTDGETVTIKKDDGGIDALQLLILREWFWKRFHRLLKALREMHTATSKGLLSISPIFTTLSVTSSPTPVGSKSTKRD